MANEITFTGSLTCFKPSVMSTALSRAVSGLNFSMSGVDITYGTITVGTSPTAVPLGQVLVPHWSFWNNLDSVNYCTLRNTFSQLDFARLLAREVAFVPLDSFCTPFSVANTSPVVLEYLILSL